MRYKGTKGKCWEIIRKITYARSMDCYTCPSKALNRPNAGHFIPVALVGSNNTLSWDTGQIRTQCVFCNGAGQGMQVEFRRHLVKELGEEKVAEFEKRRWKVDKVKNWDVLYEELTSLLGEM